METEGKDKRNGRDTPGGEATILRFPRDWFGPPEELVPFGAHATGPVLAERDSGAAGASARGAVLPSGEADPSGRNDLPASANAFWTEEAARIHDVVQAPVQEGPAVRDDPVRRVVSQPRPFPGSRALVGAGVAGLIGIAAAGLLSRGTPDRGRAAARAVAANHVRAWTAISEPHPAPRHRTPANGRRSAPHAGSSANDGRTPPATPASSAERPQKGFLAPAARSSPSLGSSEVAQSAAAGRPRASAASTQTPSQPAFGAHGALGPGTSPNS